MTKKLCETCGYEVNFPDAKLCVNCWEVEMRLDQYLESGKGMAKVLGKVLHIIIKADD